MLKQEHECRPRSLFNTPHLASNPTQKQGIHNVKDTLCHGSRNPPQLQHEMVTQDHHVELSPEDLDRDDYRKEKSFEGDENYISHGGGWTWGASDFGEFDEEGELVGFGTVCCNFKVEVFRLVDDRGIVQGHWERVIVEIVVLLEFLDDCNNCCLL
jgi:hypothetical protein